MGFGHEHSRNREPESRGVGYGQNPHRRESGRSISNQHRHESGSTGYESRHRSDRVVSPPFFDATREGQTAHDVVRDYAITTGRPTIAAGGRANDARVRGEKIANDTNGGNDFMYGMAARNVGRLEENRETESKRFKDALHHGHVVDAIGAWRNLRTNIPHQEAEYQKRFRQNMEDSFRGYREDFVDNVAHNKQRVDQLPSATGYGGPLENSEDLNAWREGTSDAVSRTSRSAASAFDKNREQRRR